MTMVDPSTVPTKKSSSSELDRKTSSESQRVYAPLIDPSGVDR